MLVVYFLVLLLTVAQKFRNVWIKTKAKLITVHCSKLIIIKPDSWSLRAGSRVVRIDLLRFLAGCHNR